MSNAAHKAIYALFDGKPKLELLYEAKEHDFSGPAFHSACDNKGPTLIVAKSKKECIFGWFTTIEWKSSGGWKKNDSGATTWLFKVESPNSVPKFIMKDDHYYGLYDSNSYLPSIEPLILENRGNQGEPCSAGNGSSGLIMPEGMAQISSDYFAGQCYFGLMELEVYSVDE